MKLSEEQRREFETVTKLVIEWLNKNCHPHVMVTIESTGAELLEGALAYSTDDYLCDCVSPYSYGVVSPKVSP